MRITRPTNLSQLTILGNITLYGSLTGAIQADNAYIQRVIASIDYPLPPNLEVILLPFIIERIDDNHGQVNGVAAYGEGKIYLTAYHRHDFTTVEFRQLGWARTLLHEIGHMVHYAHLPFPALGVPRGLWVEFCRVGRVPTTNSNYANSVAEAFAEWWRLLFSPMTVSQAHRQELTYATGLQAWMRSLPGALTLTIGHREGYHRGVILPVDVAPVIVGGRTMVPIRFVAENLNRVGRVNRVGWLAPETVIIE